MRERDRVQEGGAKSTQEFTLWTHAISFGDQVADRQWNVIDTVDLNLIKDFDKVLIRV